MTQPTPSLAEFLRARIADDEALAFPAGSPNFVGYSGEPWSPFAWGTEIDVNFARVLAECEAKRRIVDAWRQGARGRDEIPARTPFAGALFWVMKQLAAPYADHPDFDPVWAV